jgi:FkbM family methyltransferase
MTLILSNASRQRIRLPAYIATHPANRGHVLKALMRASAFQLRARVTRRPVLTNLGGLKMWAYVGSPPATKVVYGSPPDWAEMMAWRRLLKPGDLFIDVGAHVGTYTLWAAACGAEVIAVEPDPVAVERLRANLGLNPQVSAHVIEAAATDHAGVTQVTVGLGPENHLGSGHTVRSVTLDELAAGRKVAGLKLDVEGYEALVLAGGTSLLHDQSVDALQLEWNSTCESALKQTREPLAGLLRDAGYALFRPDETGNLLPSRATGYGSDVFALRSVR